MPKLLSRNPWIKIFVSEVALNIELTWSWEIKLPEVGLALVYRINLGATFSGDSGRRATGLANDVENGGRFVKHPFKKCYEQNKTEKETWH